jgi:hypothetical protein
MNKEIAIILSVYKNENKDNLTSCLNSLFTQTLKGDVYLYIDGEISKELWLVINSFTVRNDFFIVKNKTNKGLAFALNTLIDIVIKSKYKYIARMDTDDISRSLRLEHQWNFMENNKHIDIIGGFCHEFGSNYALTEKKLPINHDELKKFSITRCPFIHPTVMFRSKIFHSGLRYPTNTNHTEDMGLWFILLEKGYRFHNLPEILLDYRLDENTIYRRRGFKKALSELKLRTSYMFRLNEVSLSNAICIITKFIFHMMPPFLVKLAYKKIRQ